MDIDIQEKSKICAIMIDMQTAAREWLFFIKYLLFDYITDFVLANLSINITEQQVSFYVQSRLGQSHSQGS